MARTSPPAYAPDVNTAERGPAPGQGRQEAGNRQSENKIADTDGLRRFARDCTDVAGVWKLYMDQAKIEDERLAKILSSDLDPLLLFATLFSGILAAFLIEVRKGLEEDLQVTTNTLLNTTNQLVTMLINNQPNLTDLQPQSAGSFEPTTTTRSVNGLWFSSLMFSLTSALGASLAKGWITQFSLADSGLYWTNAEKHHRRLSDMRRWHVKWIIQCLSLLIHIAFFLFAVGLAQLLFGDDIVIGIFIGALTGIVFVMYLANTVHPIFSSTSPFRTPLSGMLRQIFRPTAQETNVLPSSKDALKAHALAWLMMMSLDPQVIRAAIRATAGLPHSRDVQAELLLSPVIYILSSGLSELLDPGSETKDMTKDMTASASYLYTLLHLVEPVPAKSDEVERLYEALETLVLPGGALFVTDSLPPQIRELALCVRGRILLLLCVEEEEQAEDKKQSDEIFDTDIPILTRACPHGQLRDELQGVLSISDPTQDGSMKAIVSRFGVPALLNGLRGGAGRIVLKQCARRLSDLMAYDRIYFQLGMDENIKCMCIALQDMFLHSDSAIRRWAVNGFKKLADYAEIRKVMRTSKLMEVFVTLLADADIQVRAAALETLTEFAEIRAAIGTSKTIGELVKLLAAEDSQVRMATINALGGLAEHEELRAAVGTPQTIGNVLSRMEDDEEDVRSAAINAFKKFSTHSEIRETMGTPEAVGELLALLVDREWEVRLATLNVLAELAEYEQIRVVIGTSETLGKVVGCVADHDPDVRTAAIDTLKKLATHADICTAMGTPETIGEFLKLMEVERWRVRVVAINTLIELAEHSEIRVVLASPEILKKIVSCLADEDLDVRAAVIDALKQLAEYPDIRVEGMGTPATIGQLVDLLAPEDGLVQVATIKTLAELAVHSEISQVLGTPNTIGKVVNCLANDDSYVRAAAFDALNTLATHAEISAAIGTSEVAGNIVNLLTATNIPGRITILNAVAELSGHEEIRAVLASPESIRKVVDCLADVEADVRAAAVNAVKTFAEHVNMPTLVGTPEMIAERLKLGGAGNLQTMATIATLAELVEYKEICAVVQTPEIFGKVVDCLADAEPDVRAAALNAVKVFAAHVETFPTVGTSEMIGKIISLLTDKSWEVRMTAITALTELAEQEELRAVVGTPETTRNILSRMEDDDEDVRIAAIEAFKKFAAHVEVREIVETPETIQKIVNLLTDPNWGVRVAALNILTDLAGHEQIRAVLGTSETIRKIVGCMGDEDEDVRAPAAKALETLTTHAQVCAAIATPTTFAELVKLLSADSWRVQMATINTLVELAKQSEIRAVLGTPEMVGKVVNCIADDDSDVRGAAVDALKKLAAHKEICAAIGTQATISELVKLLSTDDWRVQMVTIETLVDLTEHEEIRDALGTPETIGKVVGCLADNDEDVRAAAVKALKNLATHDKLRAAIRAPKPLGQLWRMFGLPYSAAATDVLTTLLGHNDFREHFEKPEQVDSVLRNLSDPNWRVRVGMVLVLQVFRTDENLRGLFITTDTTIRLLDFLGNSNTSAVAASTLATLVEYPGPQSNIVAPNSITMILAAVRSEPAKEELTTLIEALIKLDTGIDDVPVLLLTEILRQLPQATPAARTAYTDILKRLPIETIYISSNHVDKLMKLWISSDSAISAIVLQILMRLADNAQFRVLIRPELWDRLSYSIQHEKSGPALETLKGLAHDAETRRKILNSGIVHVLLNMLKSGTSDVDRWQIGLEGLLILDVF